MARLSHGLAVIGAWALLATPGIAQQNLEAGKSAAQIFSSTCSACHKSSRGLLKSVPASSLKSFLRQHYTTSTGMAEMLAVYVASAPGGESRSEAAQSPRGKKAAHRGDASEQGSAPDADSDSGARSSDKPGLDASGDARETASRKSKSAKGKKGRDTETADKPSSSGHAAKPADTTMTGAASHARVATAGGTENGGTASAGAQTGAFTVPDVPLPPPVMSSKVTVSAVPPRKTGPRPE